MKNLNIRKLVISLFLPLFLASCASTEVTGTWKEKTYNAPIKKVLIVGLSKNGPNRRIFEDTLSKDIIGAGKKAEGSIKYVKDIKNINKKTLGPIVQKEKFDTVIVARLVSSSKQKRYVPTNYPTHYNSLYGYYDNVSPYYRDQGYYVENTIVSIEINMYETKSAKLIWAITTETFEPKNVNEEIAGISKLIIKELTKEKLL